CSDGSRAMADVAHDASGPASPKPDDIALQQASRPDSPDRGKLRVFISYSRDDLYFADQLDVALNACGCRHPSRHAGCRFSNALLVPRPACRPLKPLCSVAVGRWSPAPEWALPSCSASLAHPPTV